MGNTLPTIPTSSSLPSVSTGEEIAAVRLDEAKYPRYELIPPASRQKWLATEIKALAAVTRIRDLEAREAIMMAASLDEMLMTPDDNTGNLTLPELHKAFTAGVYGKYGEFYGLSAPNLYGFVRSYLSTPEKKIASDIVMWEKKKAYAEKERLRREWEQKLLRAEIEKAKRDGTFVPTGRLTYQPKKVKDVVRDNEHRMLVRQQAKEILEGHDSNH